MPGTLVVERGRGGEKVLPAEVLEEPARLAPLLSPMAWKILRALAREPSYAGALARRLRLQEQAVYYHINRLLGAGILRVVKEEHRRGATSRVVALTAPAVALILDPAAGTQGSPRLPLEPSLLTFLGDFAKGGHLDTAIVVGSPQPHGPFLTAARDGHCAAELALVLGRMAGPRHPWTVYLDTEVRAGATSGGNLIVIGGPVTNLVAMDLNPHLPIRFDWREGWRLISTRSGRTYAEETVGLVAKITNPWRSSHRVLLLSGLHRAGTMAAVLGLARHPSKVLATHRPGEDFHRVVEGLDRDGDGRVDDVAVLE